MKMAIKTNIKGFVQNDCAWMNLGAQEAAVLAGLTFLFQDKGKRFAEKHRKSKCNILVSVTVYEGRCCVRRKYYRQESTRTKTLHNSLKTT